MCKKLFICTAIAFMILSINMPLLADSATVKRSTIIRGQAGSGPDQIGFQVNESDGPYEAAPTTIAVDTKGNVYIADIANDRILKYTGNGKLTNRIKIKVDKKHFNQTVDDMATDNNDNLYIASGHEQKIFKYNSAGTLIQSINLLDHDLVWHSFIGWKRWSRGRVQIEEIAIDPKGNVYLIGWGQLIKFNSEGQLEKKFASKGETQIPIIVLDEFSNLYIQNEDNTWAKYDSKGNNQGLVKCEQPYFKMESAKCNYPRFVDKKGFLYFYESDQKTNEGLMVKMDQKGKKYGEAQFEFFKNDRKFDMYGNIYLFNGADDKFWVDKITWD